MKRKYAEPAIPKARHVRGGEIILNTDRRRYIFMGGLMAFILFALAAAILAPN